MRTIVRGNIVEGIFGIMGKKSMESMFPEKSHYFQMMIFKALKDLEGKEKTCHTIEYCILIRI